MFSTLRRKMLQPKARVILGLLAVGLYVSAPALAQTSRDIMNRITRLENEIETLSRAIYRGEDPPPPVSFGDANTSAGTEVRLQQLETELRALTGKVEEQDYNIRQLQDQLQRSLSDMDMRLQDAERGRTGSVAPSQGTPQQGMTGGSYNRGSSNSGYTGSYEDPPYPDSRQNTSPPPAQPQPSQSAYQWSSGASSQQLGTISNSNDPGSVVYEGAYAQLKNGDYDGAESGFKTFLKDYPGHALAGNAKYWLGETYYVRGDHDLASRTFAEAYQEYPKGAKAADNLLKLGMALAGQGNTADACTALAQVEKEFPSAGPVLHRAKQEMTRLGC